jgi:hypothetical protein
MITLMRGKRKSSLANFAKLYGNNGISQPVRLVISPTCSASE